MRKIAREAVIFILLGPIVAMVPLFFYIQRESIDEVKREAAQGIYAIEDDNPVPEFIPVNSVAVPLTNGGTLFVTECSQAHPIDIFTDLNPGNASSTHISPPVAKKSEIKAPGSTNGHDCVYFDDEAVPFGGHLTAVVLGDKNQIAIEKEYWAAYAIAKHPKVFKNILVSGFFSLWGFPAGLIVWVFYRLIRFAIKG